ncbi:MAG TPA: ferric reductase-like transmembrane domain-containing protein, partial [Kribbella sp.]|nr:ferric reductase-like transmembrane domain-containing protein [Kribbella sp.]
MEPLGRRARNDSAVRLGALTALWLSLLLVMYWWVAGGGVQELGGWATGLTSLGRITGLAASVLLLAQVVLMARVPVLEAAFGQDRLARIHRVTGFTSFNLMLAHLVTITWGYAAGELRRTPATLWDLTVDYPGMLLAVGGTLALCLSVLTSIRAARRRLRYESWHLLHLYAYLGVGLALPHQLWTGQEFLASTGRTVFWWTAWAVAAATVLVYRI